MNEKLKKYYEKGKLDKDFQKLLKKEGEDSKPRFWWSREKKVCYALVYMGYCLTKKS